MVTITAILGVTIISIVYFMFVKQDGTVFSGIATIFGFILGRYFEKTRSGGEYANSG